MKIKVISVGKLKEKYLKDGIAEHSKRLSRFTKLESLELANERTPDSASAAENEKIIEKEGLKYQVVNLQQKTKVVLEHKNILFVFIFFIFLDL